MVFPLIAFLTFFIKILYKLVLVFCSDYGKLVEDLADGSWQTVDGRRQLEDVDGGGG